MPPLVSINMITYNHSKYIEQSINGVLAQVTNFDIELIICDDSSPDNTKEIVEKIINTSKKGSLIRYYRHSENIGMLQNSAFSFSKCTGKYIAVCEGDDYWIDPYKLKKQVDFLEQNEDYGLVWTDINIYNQDLGTFESAVFRNKILPYFDSFTETLINKPFFSPPTWVFRRKYIPTKIDNYCDGTFPLILDILAMTKIKFINEVTAVYRKLNESASHSKNPVKRYEFLKGVYRIQCDYWEKYKLNSEIKDTIDTNFFKAAFPYAAILYDKDTLNQAKKYLKNKATLDLKSKGIMLLSQCFIGITLLKFVYLNSQVKSICNRLFAITKV